MRLVPLIAVASACLALTACQKKADPSAPAAGDTATPASASVAGPAQIPHRKPGLWKTTITTDRGLVNSSSLCVDEASEAKLSIIGAQMGKEACKMGAITRGLDGALHVDGSCDMGSMGKVSSSSVVSGDFNSHYSVVSDSTTEGSAAASMNGKHKITIDGTYAGACPAGQKGGDMTLANGMTVNILEMAGRTPGAVAAMRK